MSFTKAKAYLESVGFADHIIEPEASTATVVEAAGNDHSAVQLTIPELEQVAMPADGWMSARKQSKKEGQTPMRMNTYTGKRFDPMQMTPEEVSLPGYCPMP